MRYFNTIALLACFSCDAFSLSNEAAKKWIEDIDFYVTKVKTRHIQPFHSLLESDFDSKIISLKSDLSSLSEVEVETRLTGITSAIGDGHSNYFMMSGPHKHFPFRFKFFENKLRIIGSSSKYDHLIGSELISINGIEVPILYKLLGKYLPGVDNQYSQKVRFEFYLTLEKLLRGLAIVREGEVTSIITHQQGNITTTEISPISMQDFSKIKPSYNMQIPRMKLLDIKLKGIELAIIKEDTAYFKFTQYPEFENVLKQCSNIQDKLKATSTTKLIVDFRGNGGGDFYTGLAFSACLQPLNQFDWLNGTALLTDGHTFSAAMSNVVQFKQIFNAKVIGEPTGGDPNGFSEGYQFKLPNSKRKLTLSIRYYPFIEHDIDAVYPDKLVQINWEDYQKGFDTVLLETLELLENKRVTHK